MLLAACLEAHTVAIALLHCEQQLGLAVGMEPALVEIESTVKVEGKTGVEMEALTAASIAALTIYDMCKAIDREMTIDGVALVEKSGGKSGHFRRGET